MDLTLCSNEKILSEVRSNNEYIYNRNGNRIVGSIIVSIVDEVVDNILNNRIVDTNDIIDIISNLAENTADLKESLIIVRDWDGDLNQLDDNWVDAVDTMELINSLTHEIIKFEALEKLNEELQTKFGTTDYEVFLDTFVSCESCGDRFSVELVPHLHPVDNYEDEFICNECVNRYYIECESCGIYVHSYNAYIVNNDNLCPDCAEEYENEEVS